MKSAAFVLITLVACSLQSEARTVDANALPLSKAVDYSDLNLQKPRHVALLYRRITQAAESVCKPFAGRDMPRSMHFRKCVDDAVERAVDEVHAPLLSEHYAMLTGSRILSPLVTPLNR